MLKIVKQQQFLETTTTLSGRTMVGFAAVASLVLQSVPAYALPVSSVANSTPGTTNIAAGENQSRQFLAVRLLYPGRAGSSISLRLRRGVGRSVRRGSVRFSTKPTHLALTDLQC